MSDNVTPIRPTSRRWIVYITVAICLTVLILAVVIVAVRNDLTDFGAVRRYFRYRGAVSEESFGTYSYDAHNGSRFAVYEDGLAVATIGGLELLDDYGVKSLECRATLSTPSVQASGSYVLCCDVSGTELILAHATRGKLLELNAPAPILDANLAEGGAFCYLTAQDGYKAMIPVYNSNQEEVYVWYSASAFFNQCAVAPDATGMAAVRIGEENAAFQSILNLFSTDSETPIALVDLGEQLVYDLHYLSNTTLCVWGENGLYFFKNDGRELGRFEPQEELIDVHMEGAGYVVAWLRSNLAGSRDQVCALDTDGRTVASLEPEGELLNLSVGGRYVSILTTEGLLITDDRLRSYARNDDTGAAIRVRQRSDGSALLLTSTAGRLYLP